MGKAGSARHAERMNSYRTVHMGGVLVGGCVGGGGGLGGGAAQAQLPLGGRDYDDRAGSRKKHAHPTMASSDAVLAKLDSAELRFGMADDAKLAKLLDPALVNMLGFLASPSPAVKEKAMSILAHISKRLKADATLPLPLQPLAKLYANPATAAIVQNFALVYIEMGLPRLTSADRAALLPTLLIGISKRPSAQQDTLLGLLLSALPILPLPKTKAQLGTAPAATSPAAAAAAAAPNSAPAPGAPAPPAAPAAAEAPTLPFLVDAADRALVLGWLLDLLLYLPPLASAPHTPPPGLSRAAAKRVCGKLDGAEVRGELLAAKKVAALRLLGASTLDGGVLFAPSETLPHWVVASCDNDHGVSSAAEAMLRKLQGAEDLEEPRLVDALTGLVLGTATPAVTAAAASACTSTATATSAAAAAATSPTATAAAAAAAAASAIQDPLTSRSAASVAVRLAALTLLNRSQCAASRFPGTLKAIVHCVFGGDATPKLQQSGCQLAQWTSSNCDEALLRTAGGAPLLQAMLRVLRGEATQSLRTDAAEAVMMRSSAYATLAKLCQRTPEHVRGDTRLPSELFAALESEQLAARASLQEALAALAAVHARKANAPPPPPSMMAALRTLLIRAAASSSSHARYCAMVWVGSAFGREDLPTRYACLLASADTRVEVSEAAARALRPLPPPAPTNPTAATAATTGNGEAGGGGGGAEAAAAPAPLELGQRVTYRERSSGVCRMGSVAAVHRETVPPHYTVAMDDDGTERSVEADSLRPLPKGWPALAPLACASSRDLAFLKCSKNSENRKIL